MRYLLTILCITTLFSCGPKTKQGNKSPYFEGFVEFNNSYQGKDTEFVKASQKTYGIKTITYLGADGSFAREYIDANNIIINREVYRPDSLKTYYFKNDSDTIFCSDVTQNISSSIIGIDKQSPLKILGHKVEAVNTKKLVTLKARGLEYYVYTTYYNDINYSINPLTYKHYLRSNVEEIFTRSPYITVGYKAVHGARGTRISMAVRIVPIHVEQWHFEIPKNKIIVNN